MSAPEITLTLGEIAVVVGGELRGDAALRVTHVAPLHEAGPDALSWLGDDRYLAQFEHSRAGAVLVRTGSPAAGASRNLVIVADPDLALCTLLPKFAPPPPVVPPGVHPAAVVAADAQVEGACIAAGVYVGRAARVGGGTQLHPGVYVGDRARIGRDCVLWPGAVIREDVSIGDRVIVHANATIGADGFGYLQRGGRHVHIPQVGTVVIEDDVEIGAGTCIDRARSGATRIGRGTKIDNLVQIAHNVTIGEHCMIVAQVGISGSTRLGRHVVLAGQVGLIDHLEVGDGVQVAAQSGVIRSLEAGKKYMGYPAIESRAFLRQQVHLGELPEVLERLRQLEMRVRQLESAADHQSGG